MIEDGSVLCVGGKIVSVGKSREAARDAWISEHKKRLIEIDCTNKVVLPGFVDSHTHPAFVAPRLLDFEKRVSGASYEEIAEAGGGIRSSAEGVRKIGKKQLSEYVLRGLWRILEQGTTTVEAKSGYGLTLDAELKSLEAIRDAAADWPGTVVPTLLGAHAVPEEFRGRSDKYVELVCAEMIPGAAKRKLARFVDVFCDRGAFNENQAALIFQAARQNGFDVRAHLGQLALPEEGFVGSLLDRFHPASLDHMDQVREAELVELAKHNTVVTLVPGANHFLGLGKYPPARKVIEAGVAVALATDYNPGSSPTASMLFVLSLACTQMKMSPAEATTAATINGACALKLQERKGSIESGKDADLAIFDVRDYREIAYWMATNTCEQVVANGVLFPCRGLLGGGGFWVGS